MEHINPRLLAELKQYEPEVNKDDLLALATSNLDISENGAQEKFLLVFAKDSLRVYKGDKRILTEPTENVESVKLLSGVGCVFVVRVPCEVVFVREEGTHASQHKNTLASVHNSKFVLGHQLLS